MISVMSSFCSPGAELLKFINDRSHQSLCWKMAMPLQRLHQTLLSEFPLARAVAFGHTIGVKRERISWAQRRSAIAQSNSSKVGIRFTHQRPTDCGLPSAFPRSG